MVYIPSGVTWFDDDDYIGTKMSFKKSTWKLEKKLSENEFCETEEDVAAGWAVSEARAVFLCSTENEDEAYPSEAIIKIRMQIPWRYTVAKAGHVRAKQAEENPTPGTMREIEALERLTRAKCSSTPTLYAWKQEKQGPDMWVPGGHIVYILMEKLPGIPLHNFFNDLQNREERDLCRNSFKESWLECLNAGVVNIDTGSQNLLWDRKEKKCYIIDFEHSAKPGKMDRWRDGHWISWNLARNRNHRDDPSQWEL